MLSLRLMLRFLDGDLGCFAPVATDRFLRSLVGIERFSGSKLSIQRYDFLERFSHLKLLLVKKKKPDILGMPGLLSSYG